MDFEQTMHENLYLVKNAKLLGDFFISNKLCEEKPKKKDLQRKIKKAVIEMKQKVWLEKLDIYVAHKIMKLIWII